MIKRVYGENNFILKDNEKEELNNTIRKYQSDSLIVLLHEIQDKYNYLPYQVIEMISKNLNITIEHIYGVITFYKDFRLTPIGKYQISVCMGTVCYIKGGNEIMNNISKTLGIMEGECTSDMKYSLDSVRCVGCCSMAPVVMVNNKIYGNVKINDIKKILDECV